MDLSANHPTLYVCREEFPIRINCTSPFPILGLLGSISHVCSKPLHVHCRRRTYQTTAIKLQQQKNPEKQQQIVNSSTVTVTGGWGHFNTTRYDQALSYM